HYKARFYDPRLGRFLQTDPIGTQDDLNLYAYVGNNPINRRDPTGLYWFRQPWQTEYAVGREDTPIAPGGLVSRLIEDYVPAGRTFGETHDSLVDALHAGGVPDLLANVPSMIPAFVMAVGIEALRTLGIIDQPTPTAPMAQPTTKFPDK
ncbi:RHS repeat-associated core domain-containing protein, partial [Alicycliphilus sp. T452]